MASKKPVKKPSPGPAALVDPVEAARAASLHHVSDEQAGIRRHRRGKGFSYRDVDASVLRDGEALARIRALAIPPAWTEVWICPLPNGHLQATGRDARGRKQYRYHPRWREVRDETKYARMLLFGAALPRLRAQVREHLAGPGFSRDKVLATVVRLLETTFMRVGNEQYARSNRSFGLTTLRDRHVEVKGDGIQFRFLGKSGKPHSIHVAERRLARIVKRCRELPGQDLFQYLDPEAGPQPISSADVNDYIRRLSEADFTAKDFRTWAGTLLAARHLASAGCAKSARAGKSAVVRAAEMVAGHLGNTPAVCRKCYIHPALLAAHQDPALFELWRKASRKARADKELLREEAALLAFLAAC